MTRVEMGLTVNQVHEFAWRFDSSLPHQCLAIALALILLLLPGIAGGGENGVEVIHHPRATLIQQSQFEFVRELVPFTRTSILVLHNLGQLPLVTVDTDDADVAVWLSQLNEQTVLINLFSVRVDESTVTVTLRFW